MYFFIDNDKQQKGPFSIDALRAQGVKEDTLVWKAGMADWTRAGDVPELQTVFTTPPPPPPAQEHPADRQQETGNQEPTQRPEASSYATPPQRLLPIPDDRPKPENYFIWALLSTFCCCLPAGIYALICSNRVNTAYYCGRYEEALHWSGKAKLWTIISAVLGIGNPWVIALYAFEVEECLRNLTY